MERPLRQIEHRRQHRGLTSSRECHVWIRSTAEYRGCLRASKMYARCSSSSGSSMRDKIANFHSVRWRGLHHLDRVSCRGRLPFSIFLCPAPPRSTSSPELQGSSPVPLVWGLCLSLPPRVGTYLSCAGIKQLKVLTSECKVGRIDRTY